MIQKQNANECTGKVQSARDQRKNLDLLSTFSFKLNGAVVANMGTAPSYLQLVLLCTDASKEQPLVRNISKCKSSQPSQEQSASTYHRLQVLLGLLTRREQNPF
jgi:hypothetical protein